MDIMTTLFDQDYVTMLYGIDQRREGREEGLKDGREAGLKDGREEEKKEIAKSLKDSGMDLTFIAKHTGLSEDEIKAL